MRVEPPVDFVHGWAEHRNRFPLDLLLRKRGFKIEYRRKGQEPIWSRQGELYTQTEAEAEARESERK